MTYDLFSFNNKENPYMRQTSSCKCSGHVLLTLEAQDTEWSRET